MDKFSRDALYDSNLFLCALICAFYEEAPCRHHWAGPETASCGLLFKEDRIFLWCVGPADEHRKAKKTNKACRTCRSAIQLPWERAAEIADKHLGKLAKGTIYDPRFGPPNPPRCFYTLKDIRAWTALRKKRLSTVGIS
jgi:hypothetical protein